MVALRWFSLMNEFMDFVVIVKSEDETKATNAILKGLDMFWDGQCEPYGSCVEICLEDASIQYAISFIPWDYEGDCAIDEDAWEQWCSALDARIGVVNIR